MTLIADTGAGRGTGEALCAYGYGLLNQDDYEGSRRHTDVELAWIADPVLREAMEMFADVIARLRDCRLAEITPSAGQSWYADINLLARRPMTIWTERNLIPQTGPQTPELPQAVQAVVEIHEALGISLRQALRVARVRPRTYHSWRENPARRPRLSSVGRLWRLYQLKDDLIEILGEARLQRWLGEDDARMASLLHGQFDEIAAAAYSSVSRQQEPARTFDGALDERESSPQMPRYPITGLKMNPHDVAGPER